MVVFRETEMASNGSEGSQAGPKSKPGRLGNKRIVGIVGAVLQAGPFRGGPSTRLFVRRRKPPGLSRIGFYVCAVCLYV